MYTTSSEVRDAPEEAEVAGSRVVLAITSPEEPAKESEPSGVAETGEDQNPDAPQKTVESTSDAQASHVEEPALLVEPRLFPSVRAPRILRSLLLSSSREEPRPSQRSRPPRLAPVLFLFRCCCCFFFFFFFLIFYFFYFTIIIFWNMGVFCNEVLLNEISLFLFALRIFCYCYHN